MGKAAIVSHLGAGKYSVKLALHREHIAEKITDLTAQLIVLDASIAALDPAAEGYEASLEKLTALKLSCEKKKAYFKDPLHVPIDPTLEAWCADLSTALAGDVGTIEIPGERGAVLIQPGYGGNAVYDDERDGQLQPTVGSRSASATFYNMAMLPGWQKFKPTYRFGVITAINHTTDICDLTLEASVSSVRSLNVNQSNSLSDVTIEYMDGAEDVFEVDDEVLVKFHGQDWDNPRVIGFKHDPKSVSCWEPFQYDMQANHTWLFSYGFDPPDVPAPPFELDTSGADHFVMAHFSHIARGRYYPFSVYHSSTYSRIICSIDEPHLNASKLKIKIPADVTERGAVYLTVYQEEGQRQHVFVFCTAGGYFDEENVSVHQVGDNGGEEMIIDLTEYGIDSPLYAVELSADVGNGGTVDMDCYYICLY